MVGCGALDIDPGLGTLSIGETTLHTGDLVSLDGTTGEVHSGAVQLSQPAAEDEHLAGLLALARQRTSAQVFARITTPAQVTSALGAGADGIVAGVDSVLAASGRLQEVIDTIAENDLSVAAPALERAVAEEFEKIFAVVGDIEFGVRAIDFDADESRELLGATELFITHPELALPMGSTDILSAQIRGITAAVTATGQLLRIHFTVRKINDPAETALLRKLIGEVPLGVGAYIATPRGANAVLDIAEHADTIWLEVRELQAAMIGVPARHLLTAEPLDAYLRRGLIGVDPRVQIDTQAGQLIDMVAAAAERRPRCRIGARLTGPVPAPLAEALARRGFNVVAVNADEVRTTILALGRAAPA
ncbi:hypothetical protein [Nocardia jiangxiensis]|uniref:hypothetical protein n=1 Tax=Nocardia jiangxiensis TaxID=282685 RepID=UPI0006871142|nr:hypothetical protein [Nocardia jiangxiensis]